MSVRWTAIPLALTLVCGCATPPAFSVPAGPPKVISVEVTLPVYTFGNFAIGSFLDALRGELAKYAIEIVPPGSQPVVAATRVDLGEITYRQWETIDVSFFVAGAWTRVGRVRVTDLNVVTLEAVAQPVGELIARKVWTATATATATPTATATATATPTPTATATSTPTATATATATATPTATPTPTPTPWSI